MILPKKITIFCTFSIPLDNALDNRTEFCQRCERYGTRISSSLRPATRFTLTEQSNFAILNVKFNCRLSHRVANGQGDRTSPKKPKIDQPMAPCSVATSTSDLWSVASSSKLSSEAIPKFNLRSIKKFMHRSCQFQ